MRAELLVKKKPQHFIGSNSLFGDYTDKINVSVCWKFMQTVQVVLLAKQLAYMLKENILPGISL